MFEMGADTGLLEIDNVSVVAGYVGTAGVVAVPTPDSAAPALTIDSNDVVVFADTAATGVDVNPGWGQRGSLLPAADAEAGDILAFHDLNYQGIALDGSRTCRARTRYTWTCGLAPPARLRSVWSVTVLSINWSRSA